MVLEQTGGNYGMTWGASEPREGAHREIIEIFRRIDVWFRHLIQIPRKLPT